MCILKCKYTVLEFFSFFFFSCVCVARSLSSIFFKLCGQDLFFILLTVFFPFSFLLWVLVCSPFCGLGPRLTYTF